MSSRVITATFSPCDDVPGILSLDPGTRLKTHILTLRCDDEIIFERSLFTHYQNHQAHVTESAIFVGYDDKVVVLDPDSGEERQNYVMYLFESFIEIEPDRILVTEKGAIYMLDGSGALVWQFGGTEILDAVFLHSDRHLFVHYWEGTEIEAGFKVPFAPLDITTGELDMTGPQEGPFDFDDLVDPDFVGGPIDRESRSRLLDNLVTLARRYPDALWIVAAREYLGV